MQKKIDINPGEPLLDRPIANKYFMSQTEWFMQCFESAEHNPPSPGIVAFETDILGRLAVAIEALLFIAHGISEDPAKTARCALEWSPHGLG